MSEAISISFAGLEDLLRNLGALENGGPKEAAGALYELGEETIAESQEIVPVDLGTLKNSKFVQAPVISAGEISVTLGYGGEASDYAIVVHENLSPTVQWQTPGTGPKYLERPVMALKATFVARIASTLKARLGL